MNRFNIAVVVMMSHLLIPVAQATDVFTLPGVTTTGQTTLSTDYRYRGVSQTSNNPAIQGALSLSHESGVYGTLWASNISGNSTAEIDAMLGFSAPLEILTSFKPTLDAGYIRYIYAGSGNSAPNTNQPDYSELFAKLGLDGAVLTNDKLVTGINYSNNYYNHSDDFWYFSANYNAPINTTGYGVVAGIGYNLFSETAMMKRALSYNGSDDRYFDYKLGATFAVQGLNTELAWIGNSLKASECNDAKTCKNSLQLSINKAF